MKANKIIAVAFGIALLVFAAWVVSLRMKGVELPNPSSPPSNNSFPKNVTASNFNPIPEETKDTSALPALSDHMPEFSGIQTWLNSPPLKQSDLRGKVVLIDFWTYSCINCIRTLPYVTSWQEKYKDKGFTVIGVHTPEFAFEKVPGNVKSAIAQYKITYPVALDNDYGTWNNYNNEYWPAEYLFDARGRLRATHFGEGDYDVSERNIQKLLDEAGKQANVAVTQLPVSTDFQKIGSQETYVGYSRMEYLGSPETVLHDQTQTYTAPASPELNKFYFRGQWRVEGERALPAAAGAGITYRYLAANANLVMGSTDGKPVRVEIKLDGKPVPADARGKDVQVAADGTTFVIVKEDRLYDLTDTPMRYDQHLLELDFTGTGIASYAFTFG